MLLSALCWQEFVVQHTGKRHEFKPFIFFTKSLSPIEGDCVTTALLTAPEILANPNNLPYVPFPPQSTFWVPIPAENCPLCFPFLVSVSLNLIIYTRLLLCMVLSHQIDISVWELSPAPAAIMNRFPVALSVLYTSVSSQNSPANSPFLILMFIFLFYSPLNHCYTRELFYPSGK